MSSCNKVSKDMPAKPKKPKNYYSEEDKQTLNTIINTSKNGKFSKVILGESSSNTQRRICWEEIKDLFNVATGKEVTRKQIRDYYSKLKEKEKTKHDQRIIRDRKLKEECGKTGSGSSPHIPPDDDPDEDDSNMFSQELDPVTTVYNKLSKPATSTSTLADTENDYHPDLWNEDIMTAIDGTPLLDSMGNPVVQPPRFQLPAKKTIHVPVTSTPTNEDLADAITVIENMENETSNRKRHKTPLSRKQPEEQRGVTSCEKNLAKKTINVPVTSTPTNEDLADAITVIENKENVTPTRKQPKTPLSRKQPEEQRGVTSSEKNLPSNAVKKTKKINKTSNMPSLNQGVHEFYRKSYSIQKKVSKYRITLLKKKVNVEDLKLELLRQKATNLGMSVPDNLFESDSSSDSSSENEDCDPLELNM